MMRYLLSLIFISLSLSGYSQNTWVFFADKDTSLLAKPELFLSQKALERREAKGITVDIKDLPVKQQYIQQLKQNGYEVMGTSKWLNAALIKGEGHNIKQLRTVVQGVEKVQLTRDLTTHKQKVTQLDKPIHGVGVATHFQHKMIGVDYLHEKGYFGQGVTITIMDGGFYNVDSFAAFKPLWDNGQITHYRDFVDGDDSVFREDNHGMSVLSIIGGNIPGEFLGVAPQANFILCRTEDGASETHQEELNWVKAMEWADSIGTDIIHSSLGYSTFDSGQVDYTWLDMDGNTTIITIAADIAASRGILVTNSAGNEGQTEWQFITAPCDGDSVLCVGAVDSFEVIAAFSSHGPAADWRFKPEVVALGQGTTLILKDGTIGVSGGTSFSGPLVAGLAACLMSAHPEKTNMEIFNAITQSGDRYPSLDNYYGQGIPHGRTALCILEGQDNDSFEVEIYPNPTATDIKINGYVKNYMDFTVEVTNALGQKVWEGGKTDKGNIDITVSTLNWEPGVYFVRFTNGVETRIMQVVVV